MCNGSTRTGTPIGIEFSTTTCWPAGRPFAYRRTWTRSLPAKKPRAAVPWRTPTRRWPTCGADPPGTTLSVRMFRTSRMRSSQRRRERLRRPAPARPASRHRPRPERFARCIRPRMPIAPPRSARSSSRRSGQSATARRALVRARQRRQARAIYNALQQLDDRTLHDLGFYRDEIASVAAETTGQAEHTRIRVRPPLQSLAK